MKTYRLRIGSKSKHKASAVRKAVALFPGVRFIISTIPADSLVGEQPIGLDEMHQGAKNRADGAQDDDHVGVGIENGVVALGASTRATPDYIECAVIVLASQWGYYTSMSTGVQLPAWTMYDENSQVRPKPITRLCGLHGRAVDRTNPHSFLTGGRFDRDELLSGAVAVAIAQMLEAR